VPYINSVGSVCHGVGGGNAHLNNVAFSPGAVLGWMNDTTVAFTNASDSYLVSKYDVPTTTITRLTPNASANNGGAGGNHAAWWLAPAGTAGLYATTGLRLPSAGMLAMGPDGAIAYKPSYSSSGPTRVRELSGADWQLTPNHAYALQLLGAGRAIWIDSVLGLRTIGIPTPAVLAGPIGFPYAFLIGGVWWIGYWSELNGTVMHPFTTPNLDHVLVPAGVDNWPAFRALSNNTVRFAWSSTEAEQAGQITATTITIAGVPSGPTGPVTGGGGPAHWPVVFPDGLVARVEASQAGGAATVTFGSDAPIALPSHGLYPVGAIISGVHTIILQSNDDIARTVTRAGTITARGPTFGTDGVWIDNTNVIVNVESASLVRYNGTPQTHPYPGGQGIAEAGNRPFASITWMDTHLSGTVLGRAVARWSRVGVYTVAQDAATGYGVVHDGTQWHVAIPAALLVAPRLTVLASDGSAVVTCFPGYVVTSASWATPGGGTGGTGETLPGGVGSVAPRAQIAPRPRLTRQYPHVDAITDWRAQQTSRLLWDRVFDLEERLQASEQTAGDLVPISNSQDAYLASLQALSGEALTLAQITRSQLESAAGAGNLPAQAPNMFATVQARLTAGVPGGGTWDLTVQLGPTGQSKFVEAVVDDLHAIDVRWGHVHKSGGQNGSVETGGDGHAVDAINWKNPDGVTAEVYDIVSGGGAIQWLFQNRDTDALARWKYPASGVPIGGPLGGSASNPIIAMSSVPANIEASVAASMAWYVANTTGPSNPSAAYWVGLASTPTAFSNGKWYLGWNKYWEDRMSPTNTGSADPNGGGLPAVHT